MKNKETFKVVMLPTETIQRSQLMMLRESKKLSISHAQCHEGSNDVWQGQRLFILSNNQIKESDLIEGESKLIWGVGTFNSIYTYHEKGESGLLIRKGREGEFKLIVACNDKELTPKSWIQESFTRAYANAYNEGTPITEVDLEMHYGTGVFKGVNSLHKTRPDGSVVIHQSKVYSEQQMNRAIREAIMYPEKFMTGIVHDDKKSLTWIQEELDKVYK